MVRQQRVVAYPFRPRSRGIRFLLSAIGRGRCRRFLVGSGLVLLMMPGSGFALDNGLALTPPMGFNPWNSFGGGFTEAAAREIIDTLISTGLRDAGYIYFNLDAWATDYKTEPTERFPSGMPAFSEYVHTKGFKLGVYGNGHIHQTGAYPVGEETKNAELWASWNADYVKYDPWSLPWDHPTFADMRDAIAATGRPMILSIHTNREKDVPDDIIHIANLWRTFTDICRPGKAHFDGYKSVLKNYDANVPLHEKAGPGHWNDPDMLVVGMDSLTENENRAHFSLWCVMSAPLLIGADVRKISRSAIDILKNPEAIAVNQDSLGIQGERVRDDGDEELLVKPLRDGSVCVVMLNRGTESASMSFSLEEAGMTESERVRVRDLWAHEDKGIVTSSYTTTVGGHDVAMLRVYPEGNTTSLGDDSRHFDRREETGGTPPRTNVSSGAATLYDLTGKSVEPALSGTRLLGSGGGRFPAGVYVVEDRRLSGIRKQCFMLTRKESEIRK